MYFISAFKLNSTNKGNTIKIDIYSYNLSKQLTAELAIYLFEQ